jgi:hypothetical protein
MNRYSVIQSNEGDEENSPAAAAAAAAAKKKKEAAAKKSGGLWDGCFGMNGFFAWDGCGCCLCRTVTDCK